MFPNTFLINKNDIIIDTRNSFRTFSTILGFKRSKVILLNKTNAFYNKLSLKLKNVIVKKFNISEKHILEIKTNLQEFKTKGRAKIEQIDFNNFLQQFFKNNPNNEVITKPTNINGIPINLTGIVNTKNGITIIIYTDASLSTSILEGLIKEMNPLDNFYLENNYPFLNSITFISRKFNNKKIKIRNHNDYVLKHFKKALNSIFNDLTNTILKDRAKNKNIVKLKIKLKTKSQSLKLLDKISQLNYIKNSLAILDTLEGYKLLQKSLYTLTNNQNLIFKINEVIIFDDILDIKIILKQIKSIYELNKPIILQISDKTSKSKQYYNKYCIF